jgi:hypothetical protein
MTTKRMIMMMREEYLNSRVSRGYVFMYSRVLHWVY